MRICFAAELVIADGDKQLCVLCGNDDVLVVRVIVTNHILVDWYTLIGMSQFIHWQ